jgi:formiminotetrahydrofolate cyclodeaminase
LNLRKYDAIDAALIDCAEVPFNVAKTAVNVWQDLFKLIPIFNIEAKSDFLVGAKCLEAGIYGAHLNVLTNLSSFNDRIRCKVSDLKQPYANK